LSACRVWIMASGLSSISASFSGVAYMPLRRMEGRISSNTQRSNFSAHRSLISAQLARAQSAVMLYKALGGGLQLAEAQKEAK
ncbi:MAG: hypothetical protein ACI4SV_05840, partial [Duodenibacillus sp.]